MIRFVPSVSGAEQGHLILVCGLPGSGKTTVATRLAEELPAVRLCPDEWIIALGHDLWDQAFRAKVEALQWTTAKDLLRVRDTVIIEWGLWSRAERDAVREEAQQLKASVELRYLHAPVDVLWDRVRRRDLEGKWAGRSITREEMEAWSSAFEEPSPREIQMFDVYVDGASASA